MFDEVAREVAVEAVGRKIGIDAQRNKVLADKICAMLTGAVQNGEESAEMLNHYANDLVNRAGKACSDAECDEDDGSYAREIFAMVYRLAENGGVHGVGFNDGKLTIS